MTAANIQGALHLSGYLGSRRRRKRLRKQDLRTLYVCRPLLNAPDVIAWAKANGFGATLPPEDMHVTEAYSRQPVDWSQFVPRTDTVVIPAARRGAGLRSLHRFGEATVLKFTSQQLGQRWRQFCDAGAAWDYPQYQPHVTLSWQASATLVTTVGPYLGPLVFGPEKFAEVTENWKDTLVEKLADLHKRLGAKAGADEYIDDFVHSDAPQFKGKSKKERIRMALGAYYNKMQLDYEPSDEEVGAWLNKAGARHSKSDRDMIQTMHDHAVKLGASCEHMSKIGKIDTSELKKASVNAELGLVMGYAIVCKVDGEPYYDLNIDHGGERVPEHITEEAMLKAATDFMLHSRMGNEMHSGDAKGTYVFAFPMTTEIAKAIGINTRVTGLLVAYKPPPEVLEKFKSGEYRGFSIEGRRIAFDEHD